MSVVQFAAGDTDYIEKLNALSQQAGDVASLKEQAEKAAQTAAKDAVEFAKGDLQGYVAAAAGHAATVDVPVILQDGASFSVPENQAKIEIFCLGLTGTINLPSAPALHARYTIRTHIKPDEVKVNTAAGNNTHSIKSLAGDTDTSISIQGHYDLILYWDGTKYLEVY